MKYLHKFITPHKTMRCAWFYKFVYKKRVTNYKS